MFRLVRFFLSLALLGAIIWCATRVPLGNRTLWGHLRAISGTREAHDLAAGTAEEAHQVAERVRRGLAPEREWHPPMETVDERDRRGLDHMVQQKSR
jgi:hypothetical protein